MNNNNNETFKSANLQNNINRNEAAQLLNVSERSVNSAKKVERQSVPELFDQITNEPACIDTIS